ncbi:MAG: single-stranded DNA-binding protein [Sphingobacteriales bacterium]|nr:MAG: single-stranded DNA-binding protein [Sphingobacteriales bacterium]
MEKTMSNNCTVELKGNLGKDAKLVKSEKGEFVSLSIATTDSYKDKNGQWQNKETLWHDVIIFNPSAITIAKDLNKGDKVHLKGTLSYKQIESKEGYTIPQASIVAYFLEKVTQPSKEEGGV